MMPGRLFLVALIVLSIMQVCSDSASAAVAQLSSPAEIPGGTTITFDGYSDYTIANTLFESEGFTFTRDDGARVYLWDWTGRGRGTTSPSNVLATVRDVAVDPTWATHLNAISSTPLFAIGAYFGNDQNYDLASVRMSAFGLTSNLLGSVQVPVNNNTDVDQFIGLRSDAAIARVRFDNLKADGTQSEGLSVVIDDLVFSTVHGTKGVKEVVLAQLITLRTSTTNRFDARELDRAIKRLTKSVAATLWVDETHLNRKHGGRVFFQEWLTVRTLCHCMKSKRSHISDSVLQGFIDQLFQADRTLADVAIQDAIAAEVSSRRIELAQRFLTYGDTATRDSNCSNGIGAYKIAWKLVTR